MNLIYMARPVYGGWVSLTAHLALKEGCRVFKLSKKSEKRNRPFGYGVTYKNTATWPPGNSIITALDKHHYNRLNIIPDGTFIIIHDPTEITNTLLEHVHRFRVILIRQSMKPWFPDALVLPHPFFAFPLAPKKEVLTPVSISRIDFDKNIGLILDANKVGANVLLFGAVNRLYVFHKLGDDFRQWWKGAFKKSFETLAEILSGASAVVDMSTIRGDGQFSQYTFLEAIYAGVPLVLNKKWFAGAAPDSIWNEENFATVSTGEELAAALKRTDLRINKEALTPHLNVVWKDVLFPDV